MARIFPPALVYIYIYLILSAREKMGDAEFDYWIAPFDIKGYLRIFGDDA